MTFVRWWTRRGSARRMTRSDCVASSDLIALGAIRALRRAGMSVPGDVSVVGYDDMLLARLSTPALTTIRQDFASLGALIMQKVLIAMEEPDNVTESTPLPTSLIVRGSTRRLERP